MDNHDSGHDKWWASVEDTLSLWAKGLRDAKRRIRPLFTQEQNMADGVYVGPAGVSFAPYPGGAFIGINYNLEVTWQATKELRLRLTETYSDHSEGIQAHGGRNSNYLGLEGLIRI